jgi:hypothetical protein
MEKAFRDVKTAADQFVFLKKNSCSMAIDQLATSTTITLMHTPLSARQPRRRMPAGARGEGV